MRFSNFLFLLIILINIQAAIQLTNEQLGDLKNRLNQHRHINASKLKQLEELQTRYDLMVKEAEEAVQTDAGESETAAVG